MSLPASLPQVLDFLGTPLVIEPPQLSAPEASWDESPSQVDQAPYR
jgi:hypothetical protein